MKNLLTKGGAKFCIYAHTGILLDENKIFDHEVDKIAEILEFYQYHTNHTKDEVASERLDKEIISVANVIFERNGMRIKTYEECIAGEPIIGIDIKIKS